MSDQKQWCLLKNFMPKTYLQHCTQNDAFRITICVIHEKTAFLTSFSYSCKWFCCFKNSFNSCKNSCSSCKLENSRVSMSNKNTHKKNRCMMKYANGNTKFFFQIIFKWDVTFGRKGLEINIYKNSNLISLYHTHMVNTCDQSGSERQYWRF